MPSYVLVLIGSTEGRRVISDAAHRIVDSPGPAARSALVWLAEEGACEIAFDASSEEAREWRDRLAGEFQGSPVDICLVPAANRRKKLLVADMDSTIIQQECIDEMADVLGLKAEIASITERAMRGEMPFEDALRARMALLAGITEAALDGVYRERITLMPGARTLVATMRRQGAFTALVSGGFTFFTSRVAAAAGFDASHANALEVADGRITGSVIEPVLGREAKLAWLESYARQLQLDPALTLAVGDGANDLAMIKAAGLGVAYRAKPIVVAEAHTGIKHGDLTALLYLQGYRQEEHIID